jgi:PAS domain S-box-containing protein
MDRTTFQEETAKDLGRFVFFNLPVGIFRSTPDPAGKFLLANPALIKMLGYETLAEFLEIPVYETYFNPEERRSFILELLARGEVNQMVLKLKKKCGQHIWGAVTARVTEDETGKAVCFYGAVENITEHKENELRLIEERKFSESILEALPGLFWLNDENGRCIRWNKNVEAVYGYSPEELKRLHALRDVTAPESLPALIAATNRALNGGSGYCEYEIKTKFGKKIAFAGDSRLVIFNEKKYLACVELDITKRKEAEEKLQEALAEIKGLKELTDAENIYLLDEINNESNSGFIVGRSSKLNQMLHISKKVAPTKATVLIQGETGTGKGLLAKFIHNNSPRCKRPLIKLNCANLPATLIESILFGHEKGAFTNANTSRIGRFELANESTILLDEIAELPLELQAKLLRVIEEGEFEPLGSSQTIAVDVRIIAATNRNLEEEVKAGRFRQDLLFRLNVYPITTPPLRERKSDISLLVRFFIGKFNKSLGKSITKIPNSVNARLEEYSWPGNIRELQNVIERAMINSSGDTLHLDNFSVIPAAEKEACKPGRKTLQELEYEYIHTILKQTDWVIEGEKGAAQVLGLNPSTLRGRMRKLGIHRPGRVTQF